jgi:hypothetical protein
MKILVPTNIMTKMMFLGSLLLLPATAVSEEDHSKHDHSKHDHSEHYHSKHDHEGHVHHLKPLKIGDVSIQTELIGEVETGKLVEAHISVSKMSSIKTIRAWIGIKNGRGSRKSLLEKEGAHEIHGKIEVPKELKSDFKLWFDVILTDGSTNKVHLELPEDHDDHEGHDHKDHDDHK